MYIYIYTHTQACPPSLCVTASAEDQRGQAGGVSGVHTRAGRRARGGCCINHSHPSAHPRQTCRPGGNTNPSPHPQGLCHAGTHPCVQEAVCEKEHAKGWR